MTAFPYQDAIAIDTNIFEHLLNPQHNIDNHIGQLLVSLQSHDFSLITDANGRIHEEYKGRLVPIITNASENRGEIYILKYWISPGKHREVTVDLQDDLMKKIRGVIKEKKEAVDRIFVYVALKQGRVLISNDKRHIIEGPPSENKRPKRATRLIKGTKKLRPNGADILTSQEARSKM